MNIENFQRRAERFYVLSLLVLGRDLTPDELVEFTQLKHTLKTYIESTTPEFYR